MKYILYYSNFCDHSKKLLLYLAKEKQAEKEMSYICIDNRKVIDGKMYSILNNGKMILVPKNIKEVPSLLLLNHGNTIIVGNKITQHFAKSERETMMNEPNSYSFNDLGSGMSDSFSYLDTPAEDLMAKGNGGMRTGQNFVPHDHIDKIETPPEEEFSNNEIDMDSVLKKRTQEINLNN